MKMYKKTKCEFIENRIMHKNNAIGIPFEIAFMLDELEDKLQRARYIMAQPQAVKAPSEEGFVREHVSNIPCLKMPDTPVHDAKILESMALMDEIDSVNVANEVNETMVNMKPLVDWAESKWVADYDGNTKFDLKLIGNPLELTGVDILRYIMEIKSADRWACGIDCAKVEVE